jgi:UDP-N-acetylglucosamine acyltransferase
MSQVHPTAIVHPGAELGVDVQVGPYCIVGPRVELGDRTHLLSHVVVEGTTQIGEDCVVHPFAYLGGPPQHLAHKGEDTRLIVGDRNHIREHVTFHTGTMLDQGLTQIGSDGLYMVGCHVAHDCIVGNRVVVANNAAMGGHVKVGDNVFIGGLAGLHQHSRVGGGAFIGAGAVVTKDVIPFGSVWGNHAHLEGLNLVGLRRRGYTREAINTLRAAYRLLFADEGTFQERLDDTAQTFADVPEVMAIVDFIRVDGTRPLCLPKLD